VNLLLNKYTSAHNNLQANASSNNSPIWSSIIKARNILKDAYSWRTGSGSSSFWFNNCWNLGILGSLVPYIDIHDLQLTIKDVLSPNDPHIHILYTNLSFEDSEHINHIHMNFNDTFEDVVIWSNKKNGTYSPKSGYNWLLQNTDSAGQNRSLYTWCWIWKVQLPEKYKFLFWLACHNLAPTLFMLNHRNLAPSATCSHCEPFSIVFVTVLSPLCYGTT